jgi:iron complex outermembrane receptor protein
MSRPHLDLFYLPDAKTVEQNQESMPGMGVSTMHLSLLQNCKRTKRRACANPWVNLAASLLVASSISAQTTPSGAALDNGMDSIPEILVTAQKRTERLQDVPVSVTAIGSDTLREMHLDSPGDLGGVIPNLQAQTTLGEEIPIFSLRGVSMSDFSLNQASPVATYFDEVYKGNFALLGVSLFDLERIEVLRGPQGTLYGKNTTGGAINIVARKPGFDTEGYASAGYGNYNRVEFEGAFQKGISDTLAARIAFTYTRADGWFKNLLPGRPDMNAKRDFGIRASVLFKPTDHLEFVLRASTSLENPTNYGIYFQPYPQFGCNGGGVYAGFHALNPITNPNVDDCRIGLGPRQTKSEWVRDRENRTYSVSLTTTWHPADRLTLTAVSAWDKATLYVPEDSDGSFLAVIEEPYSDRVHQVAQDLRISSDFTGPFNFIAGVYFNRENVFNSTAFRLFTDIDVNNDGVLNHLDCEAGIALGLIGCQVRNSFDQVKDSKAFYTDLSFAASQHFTLRGGLRYTHDKGEQSNLRSNILGTDEVFIANLIPGPAPVTALGAGCSATATGTVDCRFSKGEVTGKLGLDYKTDAGNLLYATVGRGYRASGFNAQAFFQPGDVSIAKPEVINSYEIGSKLRVLDNRLQVNSAIFYYAYKNQQVLSTDPITAAQQLINLNRSRIAGGEIEIVARPIRTLSVTSGIGILNTRVEEGSVGGISVAGTKLASAPTVNATAAVDWTFFTNASFVAVARIDGSFSTRQYFDPYNHVGQGNYGLVNARFAVRSANDRWGIAVWGKNLFDTLYFTSRIDVPGFGFIYNHLGPPTMYGISVDYHY